MFVDRNSWSTYKTQLEELFFQSFGKSVPAGYLDWRYIDNRSSQFLFSAEFQEGELLSSYSAFPLELVCNDQRYSTAMSMTTMTHPRGRGKGLFPKLASELYEYAESEEIGLIWGFPNNNSHSLFNKKLDWSDIYEIPTLTLCLPAKATFMLKSADVKRDDEFNLNYALPPRDGLIRVNRTREYLKWRYTLNPENQYDNYIIENAGSVSSYVVTKLFAGGIDLVDIQCASNDEANVILSHIIKIATDKSLDRICCWAPTHHSIHGCLERIGFYNAEPITYFGGRKLYSAGTPGDWCNYKNWYIQMGDSDVY